MAEDQLEKVSERLKDVRVKLGLTQGEFALKLDIDQPYYSKIEKGTKPLPKKALSILAKDFGLSADWLLYGREKNDQKDIIATRKGLTDTNEHLQPNQTGNLYYLGDFVEAGTFDDYGDLDYSQLERYSFPGFTEGKYFIYNVRGDSMAGTFNNGDRIIVKPVSHQNYIEWGWPYVIRTVDGQLFKRIYPNKNADKVILRSDNELYHDMHIKKDIIKNILRFEGVQSFNGGVKRFKPEGNSKEVQELKSLMQQNSDVVAQQIQALTEILAKKNINQ